MRKLNSRGIDVSPTVAPGFSSSRRHFLSATSILGGLLASVAAARAGGWYDKDRHGGGGGGAHCFLKGTQILTPQGERPIEDLQIGEMVTTVSGEAKPVKWIGRMRFERDGRASWDDEAAPVKIARGAFNGDLPDRDLYVSFHHCLYINGLLIPARDLINGSSITQLSSMGVDVLEYLHIELDDHDVILANGVPAETLEGNVDRADFDNFEEYVTLYGATLTSQTRYAPVAARNGRRQALQSHLRGMFAPIYDRRQPLEIIQDELARQADRRSAA
jgi:Hint domain-containing protein